MSPVIGARGRRTADRRIRQQRPADHGSGRQPRDLDCSDLESGRLQLRLHRQQHVEKEPPGPVGRRRRRPEPQLPQAWSTSCAGSTSPASDTYKGPSPASEPETQTMMTWSRRRAVRQGHRLSLQRPRSAVRLPLSESPLLELDGARGRDALAGVGLWRAHAGAERRRGTL